MTIRILLADDHRIVRHGLRLLIESQDGFDVVGEAADGRSAVRLAAEHEPDLVLMDVSMSGLNGVDATMQIRKDHPSIRVIGLSMHDDLRYVTRMLSAGASGYLLKSCAYEELVGAIQSVMAGRTFLSKDVVGVVVQDYVRHLTDGESAKDVELTAREREIVQLLAEGRTTKEMAKELCISKKTVETHRRNVMNKLDLHSVAELTKYAIREGLTQLAT